MSKKKKHQKSYVAAGDYQYDEERINQILSKANMDVEAGDFDEDGHSICADDYTYQKPVDTKPPVTVVYPGSAPSYQDFTQAKNQPKKEKKKKKVPNIREDYDLDDVPVNIDSFIQNMVEKDSSLNKAGVPIDVEEPKPDMPIPDEEEEELDESYSYSYNPVEHLYGDMEHPDESVEMVAEDYAPELAEKMNRERYTSLISVLSMDINYIEPLHRLIISDYIAPSAFYRATCTLDKSDYDESKLISLCFDENGFSQESYTSLLHLLQMYLICRKHPCAIFTEAEFYQEFASMVNYDKSMVKFFSDYRRNTPYVYAYVISKKSKESLERFVNHCKNYILTENNDKFLINADYSDDVRQKMAKIYVYLNLCRDMHEREFFDADTDEYTDTLRTLTVETEDGDKLPAFNNKEVLLDMMDRHGKTVYGEKETDTDVIDQRMNILDYMEVLLNGERVLEFYYEDDDFEGEDTYPEAEEEEEDVSELLDQISEAIDEENETDEETNLLHAIPHPAEENVKQLYQMYLVKKREEHKGDPNYVDPTYEEFLEDSEFRASVSTISLNTTVDVSTTSVEPAKPEYKSESVTANTMMDALAKSGYIPKQETPSSELDMVIPVRKKK